ncbi:unnamed protein product [Diatraea saccharalis]|uniref:Uncharacterized protein n=1 Tax=Diatraea saccharalis TaxID=40085 RepID=A0A9N9R2T2_9NEOP|nr:unnamed protein product [Diatraea saccharalis]
MSYGILMWGMAADIESIFILQKRAAKESIVVKVLSSFMGQGVYYFNKIPMEILNLPSPKFKTHIKNCLLSKGYYTNVRDHDKRKQEKGFSLQDNNTNESNNITRSEVKNNDANINIFLLICIIGVSLGLLLEILHTQNRNKECTKGSVVQKPKYWVYSSSSDVDNKNGLLKHVHLVLERYGYEKTTNSTPSWSLLWSHDYPFRALYPSLHKLKARQMVNHFPGTGFITNKVDLATTDFKFIPKAFKLPQNKKTFLEYAAKNKHALFLEKHNQHRGVFIKNVSEIDLSSGESFVQEYVQKPYLVDGHKFDIGVYVVLTSVDPLRVYWYKGDVLFRYCPAKYYPFDAKDLDKYVIGDDYLPTWKVPSLAHPYTALGFGMKSAFDIYAKSKGDNPSKMWQDVQRAISEVFVKKEKHIVEALKQFSSPNNFFELMRFDLVIDEDMRVYLLEANMSPNLSSAHYPPNQLLYEQVLYNLFLITGVGSRMNNYSDKRNLILLHLPPTPPTKTPARTRKLDKRDKPNL